MTGADAAHAIVVDLARRIGGELGPRPCGGDAIRRARQILAHAWQAAGARDPREEPVTTHAWTRGPIQLDRVDADGHVLATLDALDAYPAVSGDVTGRVVDLRAGAVPQPGCIAILPWPRVQTPDMRAWAAAGIAGALIPGQVIADQPQLWYLYREAAFPVLGVAPDLADALAADPHARVRMRTHGALRAVTCANLVADLGPAAAADTIVLGAHLDSHPQAPCVFDNLSGILGISAVLAALAADAAALRRRLLLIAYTGEEVGWAGSLHAVDTRRDSLDCYRAVVNFDSIDHATARGIAVIGAPDWVDAIAALQTGAAVRDSICWGSDYLPWVAAGIPAMRPADFHGRLSPWTHLRGDTLAVFDPAAISANVAAWLPVLRYLLTAADLPATPRRPPAAVRADLAAAGQLENLGWRLPVTPLGAAVARRLDLPTF